MEGSRIPPDGWVDVEAVFAEALDLGAPERATLLDLRCAGRAAMRAEVESLLNSHDRAGGFLGAAVKHQGAVARSPAADASGTIAGAFRLVAPVGRGGMGVVYLAERADGDFTQRVAIKLIDTPLHNADVLARFRVERQILATLTHPHIVTLLDGGFTDQGQAFLAMEFVDGAPITTYSQDRRLSLDDRLALAQQVCSAVQYAHQHGVVHRDLKPANILVTRDGVPKVLDFGVAKMTDPSARADDPTLTGLLRPLTPNYASPEQVRGLPVTIASDIYALGVVLYELLSNSRPYDTTNQPLDLILQIVVDREPPRPSVADTPGPSLPYDRQRLAGDLDAIVLKALSKDPSRRYASAQELSDDIARYQAGRPVFAREVSLGYLFTKIARRHRAAFVAASVSVVALLLALGVSLWQTRIAVVERNRAAQRFNEVRRLANALIFKIDTGVRPLAGSTPVRQMIVAEALTYLEQLSRDPAGDDGLRLELAGGYRRIGDVQGKPSAANLGDRKGAFTSYRKGIEVLRPLVGSSRATRDVVIEFVNLHLSLAGVAVEAGAPAEARTAVQAAAGLADAFVRQHPGDDEARRLLGSSHFQLALVVGPPDALVEWQKAGEVFDGLLADKPEDPDRQRNVALVQKYLGGYFERSDPERALPFHRRALELDEKRLAANPSNRSAQFDVAVDLSNVALAHWKRKQFTEAAAGYERSLEIRRQLADSDPKDVLARSRLAYVSSRLSGLYTAMGRFPQAIEHARTAVRLGESMAAVDAQHQQLLADDLVSLGEAEAGARHPAAACVAFRRAQGILTTLSSRSDLGAQMMETIKRADVSVKRGLVGCGR